MKEWDLREWDLREWEPSVVVEIPFQGTVFGPVLCPEVV